MSKEANTKRMKGITNSCPTGTTDIHEANTKRMKGITNAAKRIRREHPGMKWTAAIKQAGREYREGHPAKSERRKRSLGSGPRKPLPVPRVKLSENRTGSGEVYHAKKQLMELLKEIEKKGTRRGNGYWVEIFFTDTELRRFSILCPI